MLVVGLFKAYVQWFSNFQVHKSHFEWDQSHDEDHRGVVLETYVPSFSVSWRLYSHVHSADQ